MLPSKERNISSQVMFNKTISCFRILNCIFITAKELQETASSNTYTIFLKAGKKFYLLTSYLGIRPKSMTPPVMCDLYYTYSIQIFNCYIHCLLLSLPSVLSPAGRLLRRPPAPSWLLLGRQRRRGARAKVTIISKTAKMLTNCT